MIHKTTKALVSLLVLMSASATTAFADGVEGNVALSSNYVFRGITQTSDGPAVSGGFDWAVESGFYAGSWASSVDFGDDTTMEIDFYGGYAFSAGGFDFDLGGIYYAYTNSPKIAGEDQDFLEFYAGGSRSFGSLTFDAKLSYSEDFYAGTGQSFYTEAGAAFALSDSLSLGARIGSSTFNDLSGADYDDWQIGLSGEAWGVGWDVRFHDTSDIFGDAFVISISQSFGS